MARAASPVIGVVLLVALTVICAATVGVAIDSSPTESPELASFDLVADGETETISITHRGGATLDLTETELHVEIDGRSLESDPPVPFFAARGFVSGPTGPFNAASSDTWRPGETGSIRLARTNDPPMTTGATVTVQIIHDGTVIAEVSDEA